MTENSPIGRAEILAMTSKIVSAYVANTAIESTALPDLIQATFTKISALANDTNDVSVDLTPAVPIKKSVTNDFLICLEDGKRLKMLKRHLMTSYNMTLDDYRVKWGLPKDYPMVAPAYALKRRELAVKIGLGRKAVEPPKPVAKPRASERLPDSRRNEEV